MSTEIATLVEKAAATVETLSKRQVEIESRLKSIDGALDDLTQKSAFAGRTDLGRNASASNPAADVTKSAAFQAFAKRQTKTATIPLSLGLNQLLVTKSTLVADSPTSDGPGIDLQPLRLQGLANDPRRRLGLLESMARMSVQSGSVTFNRLDSYASAADYQTEQGGLKPEASVPSVLVTCPVATIAHWLPIAEQVLQDEPMLRAQLDSLLRYGLLRKVEDELVNGAGGTGEIAGLTDPANHVAFTPSTNVVTYADAIAEALAALDIAGWNATAIVMHPDDWSAMRTQRATTSNEYLVGSWANPAPPTVWGVSVITTPAITAGHFIAFDGSQTMLLDRMAATVELGYSGDGFTRNIVVMRAECRVGLAVMSPSAVRYGDLY